MARGGTSAVVKSRFVRPGSGRTTPAAYRGRAGAGARRQIGAALRYIATRDLGPDERREDRALFSATANAVDQRAAREELARLVTAGVAYHSLVLSPGPLGDVMTVEQMQAWTRHMMADLEERWGGPVTWYAAVHQHTAHIHAHVIVAASRERAPGSASGGAQEALAWTRFVPGDFAAMRASGDHWAWHERRETLLLEEVERYSAEVARTALTVTHGGGGSGGRSPSDRDELERERAERTRR
jgi:hypothetical protein